MPAVDNQRHVNVDDVAIAQRLVIGDAVADHVVDRGADRLGVRVVAAWVVVQRGRNGTLHLGDVVVGQLVQLVGGDPGHHVRGEEIQNFGGQLACDTHALNTLGVFVSDRHLAIIPLGLMPSLIAVFLCNAHMRFGSNT